MASIVLDLQAEAMGHSGSVLGLLRKTLVIATKLSISEVRTWALSEMEGYKSDDVPDYRRFEGIIKAFNPYHGWQPVVFHGKSVSLKEMISAVRITHAVAEIETWINSEGDSLEQPLPMEMAHDLGVRTQMSVFVAKSALTIIPDRIRSYVLNWSLELEAKGVLGEGMTFTPHEKSVAPTVVTNNFYAPQYQNNGTVGAMGDSAASSG